MEDAHICDVGLDGGAHITGKRLNVFGVFDGHGGAEVARFCERHLTKELLKSSEWNAGDVGKALVHGFHKIDELLQDSSHWSEVVSLKNGPEGGSAGGGGAANGAADDGEDGDNALALFQRMLVLRKLVEKKQNGGAADGEDSEDLSISENSEPETPASETIMQAGCTAVVAVMLGNKLVVANAGDSRAVLCSGTKAVAMSFDHKPSDARETKRITAAGGFVTSATGQPRVNGNLNLSRAIGDLKYKGDTTRPVSEQVITAEPDIMSRDLDPSTDRFMVLACDGVWDVLSNQECVDFVRERLDAADRAGGKQAQKGTKERSELLGKICEAVMERCLSPNPRDTGGIGCDNMTCTIVEIYQ